MFEDDKIINLREKLHWNEEILNDIENIKNQCNTISRNSSTIEYLIEDIYAKISFSEKCKERCDCCSSCVPEKLITKVEGVYKYPNKLYSTDYNICPICMYLATENDTYSSICSEVTTYNQFGFIDYRPIIGDTSWCFVNSNIYSKNDVEKCCSMGCYNCSISSRLCQ